MDRALNKEILRLALPSILANITVPMVGIVDTSIAGHLSGGPGAAVCIGGISVGSMIFNLLYWNFAFLRTGTGGLTAQAFGRGDFKACAGMLIRSVGIALMMALMTLALQNPLSALALLVVDGSPEVEQMALRYFFIRIWAAPATVSLMAFRGWFVGMQDSVSSMWTDLIVNGVNIAASLALSFGIGRWDGIGYDGIAAGTVIAQYCGFLFATLVAALKYRRKVFAHFSIQEIPSLFRMKEIKPLTKMNTDLLLRSLGFTAIYMGYTIIAAGFGDTLLACSSIMMQLLMLFSYFTDGFAYAGEALTGRFIGAQDKPGLKKTVHYVFAWSMAVAGVWVVIYWAAGTPLTRILTSDVEVIGACGDFLPWLVAMPLLGCVAFTWDGIFLGATASKQIRNSMLGAVVAFFAVWLTFKGMIPQTGPGRLHLLMAAYFAHLIFRTVYLNFVSSSSIPR